QHALDVVRRNQRLNKQRQRAIDAVKRLGGTVDQHQRAEARRQQRLDDWEKKWGAQFEKRRQQENGVNAYFAVGTEDLAFSEPLKMPPNRINVHRPSAAVVTAVLALAQAKGWRH